MNKTKPKLDSIVIEPQTKATHSIIWLHGLGASGDDFVPIVPELKLSPSLSVRFVFPHAPILPITINNGFKMRAWFDILGLTAESAIDEKNIQQSLSMVQQLVTQEVSIGIPASRIILAGFSQGALMALVTGLTFPEKLAGMIALSGYFPPLQFLMHDQNKANHDTPIFIAHGTQDAVLPYHLGEESYSRLKSSGHKVEWHSYDMAHTVCAQEVADLRHWIQKVL